MTLPPRSQETNRAVATPGREGFKKLLRSLGLYQSAVYLYSRGEKIYLACRGFWLLLRGLFANAAFTRRNEADGLPFPPARMIFLVTNTYEDEWFYESGIKGSICIRDILKKNSFEIDKFTSVLDFGCGCGRVMRHWKNLKGPRLYGSDYNLSLVEWCKVNLPFAEFSLNHPESPLEYESVKFDFIYAISVFSHLTENMGLFWIKELDRVLRPGGIMYLTFMGATRARGLPKELWEQYESGQLVVIGEEHAGKNSCAAFHPEQYVHNVFAKGFRVLDFVPGGATDAFQDVFLLQKGIS